MVLCFLTCVERMCVSMYVRRYVCMYVRMCIYGRLKCQSCTLIYVMTFLNLYCTSVCMHTFPQAANPSAKMRLSICTLYAWKTYSYLHHTGERHVCVRTAFECTCIHNILKKKLAFNCIMPDYFTCGRINTDKKLKQSVVRTALRPWCTHIPKSCVSAEHSSWNKQIHLSHLIFDVFVPNHGIHMFYVTH